MKKIFRLTAAIALFGQDAWNFAPVSAEQILEMLGIDNSI